MGMNRRSFIKTTSLVMGGILLPGIPLQAKSYLSIDQARHLLWGDMSMTPVSVDLTKVQAKAIKKSSKVRVRNNKLQAWKTENKGWFIVDQVIGKHENIDLAVGLTFEGKVKGVEILTYRESYGHEVMNPKWRGQFHDWRPGQPNNILKLDREIKNISGATLSCRHVTDGINRLTHTWDQVLKYL
jgi:Na+-translocating ferredoxin:NAD+ oxidoreductase RnfG subunit